MGEQILPFAISSYAGNRVRYRIEVILASTSNMNLAIQRIGRIVRKHKGKDLALIYVVSVSDTNDATILDLIKNAIDPDAERGKECKEKEPYGTECQGDKERNMDKVKVNFRRTEKAYNIIEAAYISQAFLS